MNYDQKIDFIKSKLSELELFTLSDLIVNATISYSYSAGEYFEDTRKTLDNLAFNFYTKDKDDS